jgi:spermidine synthase
MTLDHDKWFTEVCRESGSAFSLELGPQGRLHHEVSDFQTIDVYDTVWFGRVLVIDGFLMLSARDNFLYHEMLAHPALFAHPAPRKVLIVGGGDCGTLREVLKHDAVEQVSQVDIDERVTRICEDWFPELCSANGDPRARLAFADGIQWVKDTPAGSLDLIIVDSTDPIGPGEGLFTETFYRDCHTALAPGGMLVQQSESPLAHLETIIEPMHAAMRGAGFEDTRSLYFPQPVYPTGWWSATLARKGAAIAFERATAAEARPFATDYYSADIHRAAFAQPAFVQRRLDGAS